MKDIPIDDKGDYISYAWPGGYPIFYVTKDCGVLCPECANKNKELTKDNDEPQWFIVDCDINYEDESLYCDNCNEKIGLDPTGTLYADLSTATAATINAIRTAFQVQKLLERDARGGTRYTEIIRSHFGVVSPDSRLQRPEYLGGSSVPVNIAPVAQTSASAISGSATPQGNLSAIGTLLSKSGFTQSFTEHGVIIGLANIRAYNLIFNEWFRDENLVPSVSVNTGDGPDSDANYAILFRGKRHDYFTSCLPWPQKGPSVARPLGTSADVKWKNAPGNTKISPSLRFRITRRR